MARWNELSPHRRRQIVAIGFVQIVLALAAWLDLAIRPAARVRGPKWAWALAIGVNFFGPMAYFGWGRRRTAQPDLPGGEVGFTDR
ncbi:PLDc N-terminal domain-containing protein [Kutzneria sp. NPDC052558]|uniref:PLDc N-terminal domain-containing protein n=1 Tax=Kutzneria sp. NPDC052558 TaxID=3364121 RepID=UPI0037C5F8CB